MSAYHRSVPSIAAALGLLWLIAATTTGWAQPPEDPADTCPLLAGESVPDGDVVTAEGEATTFHEAVGAAPAIVVFYRGVW